MKNCSLFKLIGWIISCVLPRTTTAGRHPLPKHHRSPALEGSSWDKVYSLIQPVTWFEREGGGERGAGRGADFHRVDQNSLQIMGRWDLLTEPPSVAPVHEELWRIYQKKEQKFSSFHLYSGIEPKLYTQGIEAHPGLEGCQRNALQTGKKSLGVSRLAFMFPGTRDAVGGLVCLAVVASFLQHCADNGVYVVFARVCRRTQHRATTRTYY